MKKVFAAFVLLVIATCGCIQTVQMERLFEGDSLSERIVAFDNERLSDALTQGRVTIRHADYFELVSLRNGINELGSLCFLGEVRNISKRDIYGSIKATAVLRDEDDAVRKVFKSWSAAYVIIAGGTLPFEACDDTWSVSDPFHGAISYDLTIEHDSAMIFGMMGPLYLDLEAINTHIVAEKTIFADITVMGEVRNTGGKTAEGVIAIITVYNAGGELIGESKELVGPWQPIVPGATLPFESRIDLLGSEIGSIQIALRGTVVQ